MTTTHGDPGSAVVGRKKPPLTAVLGVPLFLIGKGASAEGTVTRTGFTVKANSQVAAETTASFDKSRGLANLRAQLLRDGKLVQQSGQFHFKTDVDFGSASTAASIIRGCPANGLATWRTQDGRTLGDLLSTARQTKG